MYNPWHCSKGDIVVRGGTQKEGKKHKEDMISSFRVLLTTHQDLVVIIILTCLSLTYSIKKSNYHYKKVPQKDKLQKDRASVPSVKCC